MGKYDLQVPVSRKNEAISKISRKCVQCGYCSKVCHEEITVAALFDPYKLKEPICVNCGQCSNMCPTEAIHEKFSYKQVEKLLADKKGKTVVFSIAPAVRVAFGEDLGYEAGVNLEAEIVTALKKAGADYVFDVTFAADLTIMEEAMEFVNRVKNKGVLPQFTSCCPAWVKYCEIFYPQLIPNLSTAKSPIAMQGSIIKTFFADKVGLKAKDIINVCVAPCTAKKSEIKRKELDVTSKDTDYILTTRELVMLLKDLKIDVKKLKKSRFDSPLGIGSGAGVIFGATGGVMEAALRTAYFFITGKNLKKDELVFSSIRGMDNIKEASVTIEGKEIKVCVCNGMSNARQLVEKVLAGEVYYDFIEVMNCFGGCIAGGGQPKITLLNMPVTRLERMNGLYTQDERMTLRLCHENPEIQAIYSEFLGEPNSEKAEEILHRTYENKSYMLGGEE